MDGALGMMPTADMVEVYRRIKKPSGTKASKKEHALVGIRGAKSAVKASGRGRGFHSRKSSESLGPEPPAKPSPPTAELGSSRTESVKHRAATSTSTGLAGKGAVVERARPGAAAADGANSVASRGPALVSPAPGAGAAHLGSSTHHQPHLHHRHHHHPVSPGPQHSHHPHHPHHDHAASASLRQSTRDHNTSSAARLPADSSSLPSSSSPAATQHTFFSPSSPPRTPPFPPTSSPTSRKHHIPFSLSPISAAAVAVQQNRSSALTSPTAASLDRATRPVRPTPGGADHYTNKALPVLRNQDSDTSEHARFRSRPRAASAAAATAHPSRQSPLRTKQLPQLPGTPLPVHHGGELKHAIRRGSIDDIVPELGRPRHHKHSSRSQQQHRPSHPPSPKVDGVPMPTPTNAHLMLAPLRSTTSGTMGSLAGDTLVPSAAGSSVSVSTSSTATRTTRHLGPKPLVVRNNRTYINDPSLPYPLPVDLQELHRQSLRTLLLFQLLGGPITSPVFAKKAPLRVLEVGCGSGFWSMMCHRYFDQKGFKVSFTGMDVIPLCGSGLDPNSKPDNDMNWRFVQHDVRNVPWPFADGEFDLVMAKDMCLVAGPSDSPEIWDENIRVTAPGGVLELWETDHTIRMLRPHAPVAKGRARPADEEDSEEEEDEVAKLGVYTITSNTPLSPPTNTFLSDYNGWITKALDKRGLSAVPNTQMTPWLLQEAESLTDISSIRLAVPLSEIRWEREGVGGVVTKGDGKSYIDSSKGKYRAGDAKGGSKTLTELQTALRRTALETVVGLIHSFEPILRETSSKSQDEWDGWVGKMMNDLMREGGTSWGECLEVGAWSAKKRG
ncbi:hypothetical protein Micbo1qcDRAFT_194040 [Microdochium bolleyi]|uniref:Methyltransferase domain-containing protein n=1 Tax=Microdochium bolleyi TaxID=196109 RepID=A0A136J660_9PEZI|nr:hypothetical protein Micbo1qcDRAFT_194040 [Microdochium bolleyi]